MQSQATEWKTPLQFKCTRVELYPDMSIPPTNQQEKQKTQKKNEHLNRHFTKEYNQMAYGQKGDTH